MTNALVPLLGRDGRHLAALLQTASRQLACDDPTKAEATVALFARRLRRRLRIEEQLLFVAVEEAVGDRFFEPTAHLRTQHAVLLDLLHAIERAFAASEHDVARGDLWELTAALETHFGEERQVLHPIVGALAGTADMAALLDDSAAQRG
jgi:hypothetical protein